MMWILKLQYSQHSHTLYHYLIHKKKMLVLVCMFFFYIMLKGSKKTNTQKNYRNPRRRCDRRHCLPFIEFSFGLFPCLEICCGGHSTCHRDWKPQHRLDIIGPGRLTAFLPLSLFLWAACHIVLPFEKFWATRSPLNLSWSSALHQRCQASVSTHWFINKSSWKPHDISSANSSELLISLHKLSFKWRKMHSNCLSLMSSNDKFAVWGLLLLIAKY